MMTLRRFLLFLFTLPHTTCLIQTPISVQQFIVKRHLGWARNDIFVFKCPSRSHNILLHWASSKIQLHSLWSEEIPLLFWTCSWWFHFDASSHHIIRNRERSLPFYFVCITVCITDLFHIPLCYLFPNWTLLDYLTISHVQAIPLPCSFLLLFSMQY